MAELQISVGEAFIQYARRELLEGHLPKIRKCLALLSEEDIWWRTHETNNSIGNLLLHLAGNVRQWIVAGVGEKEDSRDRAAEFSARAAVPQQELLQRLEKTLQEADETLRNFDVDRLLEKRIIQGFNVTCLDAIFHVVEHFSGHVGQIIYVTKLRSGRDLKFYDL